MSTLHQVKRLYEKSNYNFEYTSYLNSYCRSLADWSHYQGQHAESSRAAGSDHSSSMRGVRSIFKEGKSHLTVMENAVAQSSRHGLLNLWKRCVSAVEGLFNSSSDDSAQLAEESAQSCLAGLSRFMVSGEDRLELKPHSDRANVRLMDFRFQPLLLTAGNVATLRKAA